MNYVYLPQYFYDKYISCFKHWGRFTEFLMLKFVFKQQMDSFLPQESSSFVSLEQPGPRSLKASRRPQRKSRSFDGPKPEGVVMEDDLREFSWLDKLLGNVEDRGLEDEVVVESKLEIGEYLEITFFKRIHEWSFIVFVGFNWEISGG